MIIRLSQKYVFILVSILLQLLLFSFGFWKQISNLKLGSLNVIGNSIFISRGAGLVLSFLVSILLLPVCRNLMLILHHLKITFITDNTIFIHQFIAYSILFWSLVYLQINLVTLTPIIGIFSSSKPKESTIFKPFKFIIKPMLVSLVT